MKVTLNQAADFFRQNNNFTLLCHANPDGDTLGSGYALCGALHMLGKYARIVCDDKPSERFEYLKQTTKPELIEFCPNAVETIVTVDVADTELLGDLKDKYSKIDFCVDHHVSNKFYAEKTLLDTDAAACAELTWELIGELLGTQKNQFNHPIIAAIAAAIYTGVSTDTGCFRFANTTAKSHKIAAELMSYDFDATKINYIMFDMKTRERIVLEQRAYAEMEFYCNHKCAMIVLTEDLLRGVDPEDTSGVASLPKQIEGVEVGVVIKEKLDKNGKRISESDTWKISMRTGGEINAQVICSALGGGGHIRAAGCKITGELGFVKNRILREVEKQLTNLSDDSE
ncbi:MAG: bifunctional oligoribonuclease/PAP phosphatase NrnA [Oscillospiraceae bacterium]|nr:bifunctional oligoribonuclease/PAP phosphatase NrnA [Oscillospiraceae bacterium]